MDQLYEERKFNNLPQIPDEPEETWWRSVLKDEPLNHDLSWNYDEPVLDFEVSNDSKNINDSPYWKRLLEIYKNDEIIVLDVTDNNKGGVLVEGEGISGFVPISHLIKLTSITGGKKREECLMSYLGRKIALKIIECDPKKDRIIFSERAALAGSGQRKKLLSSLRIGSVLEGKVTNITAFGAFVDLGGLEGLVHLSELSWGRVEHPSAILKIGDIVDVIVIELYKDESKIALSIKRLHENPWDELSNKVFPGDIVDAVVTSIVKYGAFAQLKDGVEGLIHISSMRFLEEKQRIDEFLFEGQPVKVRVINIDAKSRRLGLSLEGFE